MVSIHSTGGGGGGGGGGQRDGRERSRYAVLYGKKSITWVTRQVDFEQGILTKTEQVKIICLCWSIRGNFLSPVQPGGCGEGGLMMFLCEFGDDN